MVPREHNRSTKSYTSFVFVRESEEGHVAGRLAMSTWPRIVGERRAAEKNLQDAPSTEQGSARGIRRADKNETVNNYMIEIAI